MGFPGGSVVKNPPAKAENVGFDPWVGKILYRKKWQLTPVFLPWKSHGQRNLVGYSPWGHKRVGYNLATKQQQIQIKQRLHILKKFLTGREILKLSHTFISTMRKPRSRE